MKKKNENEMKLNKCTTKNEKKRRKGSIKKGL